jgi:hypothetical protein
MPELARQETYDAVGKIEACRVPFELIYVSVGAAKIKRQIADNLRARRHLYDIAEDAVRLCVEILDHLIAVAKAERDRLLAQVGYLPAGHLVAVYARCRRPVADVEGTVEAAYRLPVGFEGLYRVEGKPCFSLGVIRCGNDRPD